MTAIGYHSDTEEIVKASWSLFQQDSAATLTLSERSPFPPALSEKDHPGGRTQILSVQPIQRINCHPVESNKGNVSETISDTKNWLNWNGDLNNTYDSEEDHAPDDKSDIEPNNDIKYVAFQEQQDVNATPNVPQPVQPTPKSKRQAENVLLMVNGVEMRRKTE
jgi:hypothetical protein